MSDWQPIETAPKDGTRVLLFHPTFAKRKVQLGYFESTETYTNGKLVQKSEGWSTSASALSILKKEPHEPTHWMPLPEDPEIAA